MKNNEATIFLFIASIIVGILIVSNVSFGEPTSKINLTSQEYHDAVNERSELSNDVSNLSFEYATISRKLSKYEEQSVSIKSELQKELEEYTLLNGLSTIKGKGIEVDLDDYQNMTIENYNPGDNIHEQDLYLVINDLRLMGAEGISINGLRIVYNTEIYCYGADVLINGISTTAPFKILAIGDTEKFYSYLTSDESSLGLMKELRTNLQIGIQKRDDIVIPAFDKELPSNFMKVNDKNTTK